MAVQEATWQEKSRAVRRLPSRAWLACCTAVTCKRVYRSGSHCAQGHVKSPSMSNGAGRDRPGRAAASEQLFTPFFRRRPPSRSMC